MKLKAVGVALAAGLFVLALLLVWLPSERKSPPKQEVTAHAPLTRQERADSSPPVTDQPGTKLPATSVSPNPPATAAIAAQQTPSPEAAAGLPPENPVAARPRDAQVDVNKVHLMVRDYHTLMGENPVGTNAEIMQALMGHNPRQATVGPPEGMSLNGKGELVDQWGTPYFFHQLSRDVMEIHSAGPDKVMGTADDVVVR